MSKKKQEATWKNGYTTYNKAFDNIYKSCLILNYTGKDIVKFGNNKYNPLHVTKFKSCTFLTTWI